MYFVCKILSASFSSSKSTKENNSPPYEIADLNHSIKPFSSYIFSKFKVDIFISLNISFAISDYFPAYLIEK